MSAVALILLRDISEPWMEQCAVVLRYPGKPANDVLGQRRFIGFYRDAARLLRSLGEASLRDVYLVNNENLISGQLLSIAERNSSMTVTVVVEGLMNFQERGVAVHPAWRWRAKRIFARVLGFQFRAPIGHGAGTFEPRVTRVVSFADDGLRAPAEKVVLRKFEPIRAVRQSDPSVALVMLTNWTGWMEPAKLDVFARAFVAWVEGSGYRKIQVKKHPRTSGGLIEELLAGHEEVGIGMTAEDMAPDLEAGTVIGTCSTALVTLKFLRPDLNCVDFGSTYYSAHAYNGDNSVETLLSAAGVQLVQMPATQPAP